MLFLGTPHKSNRKSFGAMMRLDAGPLPRTKKIIIQHVTNNKLLLVFIRDKKREKREAVACRKNFVVVAVVEKEKKQIWKTSH